MAINQRKHRMNNAATSSVENNESSQHPFVFHLNDPNPNNNSTSKKVAKHHQQQSPPLSYYVKKINCILFLVIGLLAISYNAFLFEILWDKTSTTSTSFDFDVSIKHPDLSLPDYSIHVNFSKVKSSSEEEDTEESIPKKYSLGPHQIQVISTPSSSSSMKNKKKCKVSPPLHIQITGDALSNIQFTSSKTDNDGEDDEDNGKLSSFGTFSVPFEGSYNIQYTWLDCVTGDVISTDENEAEGNNNNNSFSFQAVSSPSDPFSEEGKDTTIINNNSNQIQYVNSAWIKTDKIMDKITNTDNNKIDLDIMKENEYTFAPILQQKQSKYTPLAIPNNGYILQESIVSTTTTGAGFYDFHKLSNYELVCFMGTHSSYKTREAFLNLRSKLFPHQRPFKFHFYGFSSNNYDLTRPDDGWKDTERNSQFTAFRKCKHILISIEKESEDVKEEKEEEEKEDMEKTGLRGTTKNEEQQQQQHQKEEVQTFIRHLLNAFDEEHTFPALIWFFTNNHTNDNTVLYEIFDQPSSSSHGEHGSSTHSHSFYRTSSLFPPDRVRLLDNTDISSPIYNYHYYEESNNTQTKKGMEEMMYALIALRVYVLVGKQVQIWRTKGMNGGVDGWSTREGLKPNYDLVRYDWTQPLNM